MNTFDDPSNPYRPPRADVLPLREHADSDIVFALRSESTWQLLLLTLITFGVYSAHYIRNKTDVLNANSPGIDNINTGLVRFILGAQYLGLILLIPYFLVESGHPIEGLSTIVDLCASISSLIWGFEARRRVNELLGASPGEATWFHGLWTFLFTPLYFNYKVNTLAERREHNF